MEIPCILNECIIDEFKIQENNTWMSTSFFVQIIEAFSLWEKMKDMGIEKLNIRTELY